MRSGSECELEKKSEIDKVDKVGGGGGEVKHVWEEGRQMEGEKEKTNRCHHIQRKWCLCGRGHMVTITGIHTHTLTNQQYQQGTVR